MDDSTAQEILKRLDYIERYLVNLGSVSGYRYATFAMSTTGMGTIRSEVADLARQGRTHEATRLYRKLTGSNLEQAQDAVARHQAGEESALGSGSASFDSGSAPFGGDADSFGARAAPPAGPDVPADIVAMAQSGRLIQAIKLYKDRAGVDLKQAKAVVEYASWATEPATPGGDTTVRSW
jgi:hypothetical protein